MNFQKLLCRSVLWERNAYDYISTTITCFSDSRIPSYLKVARPAKSCLRIVWARRLSDDVHPVLRPGTVAWHSGLKPEIGLNPSRSVGVFFSTGTTMRRHVKSLKLCYCPRATEDAELLLGHVNFFDVIGRELIELLNLMTPQTLYRTLCLKSHVRKNAQVISYTF